MTNVTGGTDVPRNAVQSTQTAEKTVAARVQASTKSAEDAIDAVSMRTAKQITSDILNNLHTSLSADDLQTLEAKMFDMMVEIVKDKLNAFLQNMKDNIETIRLTKEKTFEQALSIRMQGISSMVSSLVGGTLSIGAGAISMIGAGASFKSASAGGKFQLGKFQTRQMQWQGFSQATNSVGTMAEGASRFGASAMEARATEERAEASVLSSHSQNMRDAGKADEEFVKTLLSYMKDMIDSAHQARSKVIG